MTDRLAAVAFRFALAAVALTVLAIAQVELERRTLLTRREHVLLVDEVAEVVDKKNHLEVQLARLTAPGALLAEQNSLIDEEP